MTSADTYASLARMLDYPAEKNGLHEAHGVVRTFLDERHPGCSIASFAEFVAASPLATLQEEYVATFDFNPATAPYLGHHLFGNNQKKGGYMISLKQEFSRLDFHPAGNELPDHLAVVLGFLAHLARHEDDAVRRQFIACYVLPGLQRLNAAFAARRQSPWQALVEAAEWLCAADCAAEPDSVGYRGNEKEATQAYNEIRRGASDDVNKGSRLKTTSQMEVTPC
jgi:nitrate reductase delta subunit